ncbi:hypothetical protein Skr01_67630 [Sphaerisporangium krabiense]|nr:hypothetical protein Skr01_67630 [Sphaerisporangium krabiense]
MQIGEQHPVDRRLEDNSRGNPPDGYAKGYFTLGAPAPPINGSQAFSATGIYADADDIVRWDRAFGTYRVAPPATVKQAFRPQASCPSNGCLNLPDDDIAVVVLSEVQDTDTNAIARHLATLSLETSDCDP